MGAIEHLTITLSAEKMRGVRARVASGDYPDESTVIERALAALDASDDKIAAILPPFDDSDPDVHAWMKAEAIAALEEYDRDPSSGVSAEQLLMDLATDRAARRKRD